MLCYTAQYNGDPHTKHLTASIYYSKMNDLISGLASVQLSDATDIGLQSIRANNYQGVWYAINHRADLETMLTESIRCNRVDMVDLLMHNGATLFPSDIEMSKRISPEMYYKVAFHPRASLVDMFGGMRITC